MNAEALIGTVLGTCTLQQLIGQGGMGAVYLAQQSRPRRQVAVKVLMPATSLKPHQLSAFLERFRRETDAAASLEHPNIMPVYEYGERGGLAYLVMPYISGGTLRDVMEQDGQMTFIDAMYYLEQMAAALDCAHAHGVIHRDIKPANMLLTPDNRLLLTDFGLVKLLSDNQPEQMRLTGAGAPVGTPDYMSPEQVIGGDVDGRADQYSLGVVLFQMITGTTPFQGETPMQIASQQLHMQPPDPRLLRSDLPVAAEQVLLRAMSKRTDLRFTSALEFTQAFRASVSLDAPLGGPGTTSHRLGLLTGAGLYRSGSVEPDWRGTGAVPAFGVANPNISTSSMAAAPTGFMANSDTNASLPRPAGTGLLSKTGLFPKIGVTGSMPAASATATGPQDFFSTGHVPATTGKQRIVPDQMGVQAFQPETLEDPSFQQPFYSASPTETLQQFSPTLQSTTNSLNLTRERPGGGNTIKLTGPVKIVQVPVAPGQYVTGLLPMQRGGSEPNSDALAKQKPPRSNAQKIALIAILFVLVVGAIGSGVLFTRSHSSPSNSHTGGSTYSGGASDPAATYQANATATAAANTIFSDPLSQNIHNLPTGSENGNNYAFVNNAYHITNQSSGGAAVVVPEPFSQTTLAYQITMEEINGDDTSANNTFGVILRYNTQTSGKTTIETFYTFEVLNQNGASLYSFYKYDGSNSKTPWHAIVSSIKAGKEFHEGHGSGAVNTFRVLADGSSFTLYVNGQKVGTAKDSSFKTGSIGMLVNWKGTEVAFSNMLVTQH